jgi:uncharacterized protein (TIGR00156 family)
MKKFFVGAFMFFYSLSLAQYMGSNQDNTANETGGYYSTQNIITVAQAKKMKDDEWVVLEGSIKNQINSKKYRFVDKTGVIVIKIEEDEWRGQRVGPDDIVIIYGEIDKDFGQEIKVDVERIELKRGI